jgi:hypothetical protein
MLRFFRTSSIVVALLLVMNTMAYATEQDKG